MENTEGTCEYHVKSSDMQSHQSPFSQICKNVFVFTIISMESLVELIIKLLKTIEIHFCKFMTNGGFCI